tara:strand:+ start:353 stop:508 length:156 start_codon:yes stop_codon:yes gene_type:complete
MGYQAKATERESAQENNKRERENHNKGAHEPLAIPHHIGGMDLIIRKRGSA